MVDKSNTDFELEWVRRRKEIFNEDLPTENRFMRKLKENPLVPIGTVATTACLVLGVYNLSLKRSKHQQFYMRARVLAQGFTVAALITGLLYGGSKADK